MTAQSLVHLATEKGLSLTVAESCTGGLLAAAITAVPGASTVFDRGFVTYSNLAKTEMLSVKPATLTTFGAVSEQVAGEMAVGAAQAARAMLAVSITGIAGPGGSDHKPEGRVCFGVSSGQKLRTLTRDFGAIGRDAVRAAAVACALDLMLDAAKHEPPEI